MPAQPHAVMTTPYWCEIEDEHISILEADVEGRYSELLGRVVVNRYLIATFYPELTRQGRKRVFVRGTLNAPAVYTNPFQDTFDEGDTLDTYEEALARELAWVRSWQEFLQAHPQIKVSPHGRLRV